MPFPDSWTRAFRHFPARTAPYIFALSNDAGTIERGLLFRLQEVIETGIVIAGALAYMLRLCPLPALVSIGFSCFPQGYPSPSENPPF